MKTLYLECYSGISGDMTVGALLDLGARREVLEKALESLGVGGYHLHFGRKAKCGIDAFDFDVHLEDEGGEHGHGDGHDHGHEHEHSHGDGHGHSHEDDHGHDHMHSHEGDHGHDHVHGCEGGQRHEHVHSYVEDHDHEHSHGEDHDHGHDHVHSHGEDHGHAHAHSHGDGHAHTHSHVHRNIHDIFEIIDRLAADEAVKEMARRMFRVVAEAESKAHGIPVEAVHFHEVGAIDSIVDIISVAVCLHDLGIEKVIVSPLAEGRGYVRCQHGVMPVPVPATANIAAAHGLSLKLTDNEGEMVTPTGAAIAAVLNSGETLPEPCIIKKIGIGAGNKDFKNANILRAMLIESAEDEKDTMWQLETNLDDCTGEALGFVMELLLEAGAADVWHTPIYMKKNRPGVLLSVLCTEEQRSKMEDIILRNTTTIGIRRMPVERTILPRRKETVTTRFGEAQVKVCTHNGQEYCYPEYDSVRAICRANQLDYQTVSQEITSCWKKN